MIPTEASNPDSPRVYTGVLQGLALAEIERLRLRPVQYEAGDVLCLRGEKLKEVLFLQTGLATVVVPFGLGQRVGCCFLGSDSIVHASACVGTRRSDHDVVMLLAGSGYACSLPHAVRETHRRGGLYEAVLRSIRTQMATLTQMVACYPAHDLAQRMCACLLALVHHTAHDEVALTDAAMSQLLGVSRPAVVLMYARLLQKGAIAVTQGTIRVKNVEALKRIACDCTLPSRELLTAQHSAEGSPANISSGSQGVASGNEAAADSRHSVDRQTHGRFGDYIH